MIIERCHLSERRACWLVGLSRSAFRNPPTETEENERLKARIIELAHERRRFGYRRIHALVQREQADRPINSKRIYRLYREANLGVRKRKRRKGIAVARQPLLQPNRPNEVWSMDFVMDALSNGRRIKCLTIVDDFSREAIDIAVDFGISGEYVTRVLDQAARFRGYPKAVRTDQGPEFTGKALDRWAYRNNVEIKLIQAGKPTQNAYIESFNGKFRDECLNEHYFLTLAESREIVSTWRKDYNEVRPHSMLGQLAPAEFAARFRDVSKEELHLATEDFAN